MKLKFKKTLKKNKNIRKKTHKKKNTKKRTKIYGGFWPFTSNAVPPPISEKAAMEDLPPVPPPKDGVIPPPPPPSSEEVPPPPPPSSEEVPPPPPPSSEEVPPPQSSEEVRQPELIPPPTNDELIKATCEVCDYFGFFDEWYSLSGNPVWRTCITMNGRYNKIIYVTQRNVLIKSVETMQIPEFNVTIADNVFRSKIMIENKYINCFLYVCGNWYAIMRLLGPTINTQYLARTEANRAYFLLKNVNVDIVRNKEDITGTGNIILDLNSFKEIKKKVILSTSNTPIILLNPDTYENINKKSVINGEVVFNIIQRFRQQKLYANAEKKDFAQDMAGEGVEGVYNLVNFAASS